MTPSRCHQEASREVGPTAFLVCPSSAAALIGSGQSGRQHFRHVLAWPKAGGEEGRAWRSRCVYLGRAGSRTNVRGTEES